MPRGYADYASAHRQKRRWLKIVTCLAAVVIFCTVYALVLPAVTLEGRTTCCGMEEHTHGESCYESALICGLEEDGEHIHDESCYEKQLICELSEHTHTDECYVNPEETAQDSETVTEEVGEDQTDAGKNESQSGQTEEDAGESTAAETQIQDNPQSALEAAPLPDGAQIPEGYTERYTVRDEEKGYAVTVHTPEGVLPADAMLSAELLDEKDEAYLRAREEMGDQPCGFVALDIHFEDAAGNEVEPAGDVYVVLDADGLLPLDADPESVTVQHHARQDDGQVNVETVADTKEETEGVVTAQAEESSGAVQAAFAVDSFSTFTISWEHNEYNTSLTVQRINEQGTGIGDDFVVEETGSNSLSVNDIVQAHPVEGYTFGKAVIAASTAEALTTDSEVYRIRNNNNKIWQYSGSKYGDQWYEINSDTIYFLYTTVKELTIDDSQLLSGGKLLPRYGEESPGDVLVYQWEKKEEGSGAWETVQRLAVTEVGGVNLYNMAEDGSELNVTLDGGARATYRVKLVSINGVPVSEEVISTEYKVPYYDALQNGSFEKPETNGNQIFVGSGAEGVIWKTTGTNNNYGSRIELVGSDQYTWHGVNYCPTDEIYEESSQCAELNADSAGALYQDVLTMPGSTMYWSLMHNGRTRNNGKVGAGKNQRNPASDTMYVLIMSTDSAMNSESAGITGEIDSQAEVTYVINNLEEFPGARVTEITYQWYWATEENRWNQKDVLYVRSGQKDENGAMKYTEWSKYYEKDDGEFKTVWENHSGSYQVPDEQYLTRYFFVAGDTELGKNTGDSTEPYSVGNHIDNVHFGTSVPPAAAGTATLNIQKTITGLTDAEYDSLKGKLTFDVSYGDVNQTLKADAPGWFWNGTVDENTGKGTWTGTYVISGIEVPANGSVAYAVSENEGTAEMEGYTLAASAGENSGELNITGHLSDGQTDNAAFSNAYTSTKADLTIVKNIYGLNREEVTCLIDGTYRKLNSETADESGLRFDVDVFEKDKHLWNDENDVKVPSDWQGKYWNIRDWTFDVSDTLNDKGFNENGSWESEVTEVGDASIGIAEGSHYRDISLQEITDGEETYYQYRVTIEDVDLNQWYRVWELHMDVPGHVLTASVKTDGAATIFDNEQNHGGRASAFQLKGDTTVTFTNRYEQGELKLTKKLEGLANPAESVEEFIFTVSIPGKWAMTEEYNDGKYPVTYERADSETKHDNGELTFTADGSSSENAVAQIKLYPGETATITLPPGIQPVITESNGNGKYLVSWNDNTENTDSFTTSAITTKTPVEVTCINTLATVNVTVRKVDGDDQNTALGGAKFLLYKEIDGERLYYTVTGGNVDWSETVPTEMLTSDEKGLILIGGLPDGKYYLIENQPPAGYELLSGPVEITIDNRNISAFYGNENIVKEGMVVVPNTKGAKLPETGGSGTDCMTIGGLLLMAAAVGSGYGLRRRRGREGK